MYGLINWLLEGVERVSLDLLVVSLPAKLGSMKGCGWWLVVNGLTYHS